GRYDEATRRLEQAVAAWREPPADRAAAGAALSNLGMIYRDQARAGDAARAFEEARAAVAESLGDSHPFLASIENNLGVLAMDRGDPAAAEQHHRRAADRARRAYGEGSEIELDARFNIALTWDARGRADEAEAELGAVLAAQKERLGARHPSVARTVNSLGVISGARGDRDRALARFEEAAAIYQEALGPDSPQVAFALLNIGITRAELGRHEDALAAFERAHERWRAIHGDSHPYVAIALTGLAGSASELGRTARVREALEQALAI